MVRLRMIEPISKRILNSGTLEDPQEDPHEVVEMTPVEEEVVMVEDHMIITDEIGETATLRTRL